MAEQTETVYDRLLSIKQMLKEYDIKIGLGQLVCSNEVNQYLTMKQNEIRKLPPHECGEASVLLSQEAAFIQSETNKHLAVINWCNEAITCIIAAKVDQYGTRYTPFDYRRSLAIKDNELATDIHKVVLDERLRIDSMEYMSNALRNVARSFDTLQQTKRGMK